MPRVDTRRGQSPTAHARWLPSVHTYKHGPLRSTALDHDLPKISIQRALDRDGLHGTGRRVARAPQYEVPPNGGPGPCYRGTHGEWRCLPCRRSLARHPRTPSFRVVRRAVVPKRLSSFEPTTGSQNLLKSCLDTRCRGEHRPRTDSPSFFDVATRPAAEHQASSCARHPAQPPD